MKLKISSSIITMWLQGRQSEAIEALMGVWHEPNEFMKFGIQMHEEWEKEVIETQSLPTVFGGKPLIKPQTEVYKKIEVLDWLWLSGITDLIYGENGEYIVDYKTGKGTAVSYTGSIQSGCYAVLHPNAVKFTYMCFNQYSDKVTMANVLLSDGYRQTALDKIVSVGVDIRNTLENMGYEGFNNVDKPLKPSEIGVI